MRGAFGKPQGTVARVAIGQPLMSVRTHDKHKASVIEALRRTKFKFPGRQKVRRLSNTKNCLSLQNTGRHISWRTSVGLTYIWDVPLAWAAPQLQYSPTACGTSQIEVNPTQVREEMGHPVDKVILPEGPLMIQVFCG